MSVITVRDHEAFVAPGKIVARVDSRSAYGVMVSVFHESGERLVSELIDERELRFAALKDVPNGHLVESIKPVSREREIFCSKDVWERGDVWTCMGYDDPRWHQKEQRA